MGIYMCEICGELKDDDIDPDVGDGVCESCWPPGWHIERNPKPIPDRRFDFDFWHDDHDGAPDGNHLCGTASSIKDAIEQIQEIEDDLANQ